MLAQGYFKGQRSSTNHKMLLFASWRNKYTIIEWPLFDAPTNTHGVFTSFSWTRCCCLHFCRNKLGLMLEQGYFKGQRSSIIHKLQLFMTLCGIICNHRVVTSGNYSMRHQVPMVFLLLVYLGAVAYISVEISLGSCWRRDILRVKGQALCTNSKCLWLWVICNHLVVITWCAIKYPWCFYLAFSLSKCCYLHFWRKKFGSMLTQGYFKGQRSSINQKL